tara:strand:+ start:98 stop:490 length:393 start_codon:yes stop_codon:yes gene_type:complete
MAENGNREKDHINVPCPKQQVAYSSTLTFIKSIKIILIDVRLQVIGKQGSQLHSLTPKLLFQYYNMTIGNAYNKIYFVLHKQSHWMDAHIACHLREQRFILAHIKIYQVQWIQTEEERLEVISKINMIMN